jgi:hypothetical protein
MQAHKEGMPLAPELPRRSIPSRRTNFWRDRSSADRYYASNDVSAVTKECYTRARPAPACRLARRPATRYPDVLYSADEYYRCPERTAAAPPPARTAFWPTGGDDRLVVREEGDISEVLQEAAARLHQGAIGLVIYVRHGAGALLRRTRAALEMMVTREVITEDQYHKCRLSYTPAEEAPAARAQQDGGQPRPDPGSGPVDECLLHPANLPAAETEDVPSPSSFVQEADAAVDATTEQRPRKGRSRKGRSRQEQDQEEVDVAVPVPADGQVPADS